MTSIPGLCGWTDTSKGAFDWKRDRGGTPSSNTGPSVDHTLGKINILIKYSITFIPLNILMFTSIHNSLTEDEDWLSGASHHYVVGMSHWPREIA